MTNSFPTRGLLSNKLVCHACKYRYPIRLDVFDSISLSLPQNENFLSIPLENCIDLFVRKETIDDFQCESCHQKAKFDKRLNFIKLPNVLCFHIQRLVWLNNGHAFKRFDHVAFPDVLTMDPYTYGSSSSSSDSSLPPSQNSVSRFICNGLSLAIHSIFLSLRALVSKRRNGTFTISIQSSSTWATIILVTSFAIVVILIPLENVTNGTTRPIWSFEKCSKAMCSLALPICFSMSEHRCDICLALYVYTLIYYIFSIAHQIQRVISKEERRMNSDHCENTKGTWVCV